ncbi:probable polygalacturonase isoform X2 [Selaginella moellendorffii]|uniref:probable polygalacturonase isoform X2 n=1 Tax=Selaginella moellendorffii TaxID=88036 RepID=UPI000D1C4BBB|nr:probable polygalacturonase isoform X2 [Selaginella moellendorffii]|eukprot:XP_024514995.1 probable polygalacturonase isoform X2 [Selaginella moellendorffii]
MRRMDFLLLALWIAWRSCLVCAIPIGARPHSASIVDFGAIGDGVTLNTLAFQNAMFYLSSITATDKGGAMLYVPEGRWLTGSFNLTSHFTLYLERGAVILGSQWPIIDPLPSYGRGRELPGGRHISLVHGENLEDVVITGTLFSSFPLATPAFSFVLGENGTIDGQGAKWWRWSKLGLLNHTRGHLVEFVSSTNIIISNVTLVNSPFWTLHPVYCTNVLIQGVTILAPQDSPNTDGIDPDSSSNVCIQDCYISNGDDMIAIKSGWDEYGIAYGQPSSNIHIRRVTGQTKRGAAIAIGSETSGGIENVLVEDLVAVSTKSGVSIRTGVGRGAYIRNVVLSSITLLDIQTAITISGFSSEHPDNGYNATAFPVVEKVTVRGVTGNTLDRPGRILGIPEVPFRDICLEDIALDASTGLTAWKCTDVEGYSSSVTPKICKELSENNSPDACPFQLPGTFCDPMVLTTSSGKVALRGNVLEFLLAIGTLGLL